MKYEVIDQQWVATEEEADKLENRLSSRAAKYGLVIGRKRDGSGFLITVERPVAEGES